jgi:glycosyl transferase family 25
MEDFPPVFVISLIEAIERRERMTQIMDDLKIPFTFIDAVDGRDFGMSAHPNYDRAKRLKYFGRDLKGGELGCTLSHKKAYEKMVKDNICQAIIFEDDVILYDGFVETVKALQNCPVPFDMVRFMGRDKVLNAKQRKIIPLTNNVNLTRLCATPGGTYAYLITKHGAQKLLPHLERTAYPIDALVGRSWETGLNWLTVNKRLASVDYDLSSYIGEARFNKTLEIKGLVKITYPFYRLWFRLCETCGKKYWCFKNFFKDKKYG